MMTLDKEQIAANIKSERIRAGFTQEEIAKVLGISRATYVVMENNPTIYPIVKFLPIAEAFGCKLEDFFMA